MTMERFRQLLLGANLQGHRRELGRELRRGILGVAHRLRRTKDLASDMAGFDALVEQHRREVATWIGPDEIADGSGGPYDARELRVYLALAERVGVPIVEAREILRLDERELSAASGRMSVPDNAATRRISTMVGKLIPDAPDRSLRDDDVGEVPDEELFRDVMERCMLAMDDVPEGWMVRSNLCGPSTLKALAGCGAAGAEAPEVRFGPDLEIGPGWIRNGNRRRVDVSDPRIVTAAAQGSRDDRNVFVARPWARAARYLTCDDPHRKDTPAAGKGTWPAEWRAFVEGGKVRGVSFYYSWAGEATPENAGIALEVARLAQSIADEATSIGAWARSMDVEFLRSNPRAEDDPKARLLLERLPREGVAFTLDFIETDEGLKVLEGGPCHSPLGMGHSCGFTGMIDPAFGNCMLVDGVAFRTLPGIDLVDTATWSRAGDRSGCVLTWEEARSLAASEASSEETSA